MAWSRVHPIVAIPSFLRTTPLFRTNQRNLHWLGATPLSLEVRYRKWPGNARQALANLSCRRSRSVESRLQVQLCADFAAAVIRFNMLAQRARGAGRPPWSILSRNSLRPPSDQARITNPNAGKFKRTNRDPSATVKGTPCNGLSGPPAATRSSASIAAARASLASNRTTAFTRGLTAWIRTRCASTTSAEETCPVAMRFARSLANCRHSSFMVPQCR
jgi:hypothetical protein